MLITSRRPNDCFVVAVCNHYGIRYEDIAEALYETSINWIMGNGVEPSVAAATVADIHRVYELPVPSWTRNQEGDTGLAMMSHPRLGGHIASVYKSFIVLEKGELGILADVLDDGWGIRKWLTVTPTPWAPVSKITDSLPDSFVRLAAPHGL